MSPKITPTQPNRKTSAPVDSQAKAAAAKTAANSEPQKITYNAATDMWEADSAYSERKAQEVGVAVHNLIEAWFGKSPKQ